MKPTTLRIDRWARRPIYLLAALVALTGAARVPASAAAPTAPADPPLNVIVRYRSGCEPAGIAALAGRVRRRLALDHSVAARLTREELRRLAACGAVESVEPDRRCFAARESAEASFGITKASADFGLSGDGDGDPTHYSALDHTIAVIDTGIDGAHHDFAGGKIIAWQDLVNGRPQPYDDNGHGTHVASIAAGAVNRAEVGGVAPAAALIGLKVLAADGSGDSSTIAQAVEWCITNKQQFGIEVINVSIATDGSSDGADALCRSLNRAVAAGIVVCVAAGNAGPDPYTIGSPAAAADAITVGNMRDVGKGGFVLVSSSSRGPTADGRVKPDLCAPGYEIVAAAAGSGSGSVPMTGTSMATPFVAGVAALMRQANPALSAYDVKAILMQTAVRFGPGGENSEYGAGRLDGYAALAQAAGRPGSGPPVPDHQCFGGHLQGSGDVQAWQVPVNNTHFPLAAALIVESGGAALELELYGPTGALVARGQHEGREDWLTLTPAKPGVYTVVVRSAEGGGDYSLDVSAGAAAPGGPAPLTAPTGLTVRVTGSAQIDLNWQDNSSDETGFEVWRKSNGDSVRVAVAPPNANHFGDRGLHPSTGYTYRVRAISRGLVSAWSNEAAGTTLPKPPAAPTALRAGAASRTEIDLAWNDNSGDETAIEVMRRKGSGPFVRIALLGPYVTRLADTGLAAGTLYGYRVRAVNEGGPSAWSNISSAATRPHPPTAPGGLTVRATSGTQLSLVWKDRSSNETGFAIYRKSSGSFVRIAVVAANLTHFADRGLSPRIAYTYRVCALNDGGLSAPSNEASSGPRPARR